MNILKEINIFKCKKYKLDLLIYLNKDLNRIYLAIFYETTFKFKTTKILIVFKDTDNFKICDYYIYKYMLDLYNNLSRYVSNSQEYKVYITKYDIWIDTKYIQFSFTDMLVKLNYKEIVKLRNNLNNVLYNYRKY